MKGQLVSAIRSKRNLAIINQPLLFLSINQHYRHASSQRSQVPISQPHRDLFEDGCLYSRQGYVQHGAVPDKPTGPWVEMLYFDQH